MKCLLCYIEVENKGISSHLRRKHDITNKEYYDEYIKKENEGKCKICNKETSFDSILTGYRDYCSSKCANLDPKIRKKIEDTSIERYGVKCNLNLKEIQLKAHNNNQNETAKSKRKATNLIKYGTENVFASEYAKQKTKETNLEKYGVEYSTQSEDVKQHIKQTNIERYGTESHMQSKEFLEKLSISRKNAINQFMIDNDCVRRSDVILEYGNGWYLSGMVEVDTISCYGVDFIKNSDIDKIKEYASINHYQTSHFEKEVKDFIKFYVDIKENDRTIIAPFELDIVIPNKNIAIECDGTYWHSSLNKDKNYHLHKTKLCEEKGYRLIHVFEEEWNTKQDIVKSIILSALGIYDNKIYARNCIIKEVESKNALQFLEENHIQGSVRSSYKLGLFKDNELVQLVCFGKNRFKSNEIELLRMCTKLNTQVIGGFSKLLKYQPYNEFISYVDRHLYNGSGYIKNGFSLITETKPSYFYWSKKSGKINRLQAQKHKLPKLLGAKFDNNKTEIQNMIDADYLQFYDCGTLKMIYKG